MTLYTYTLKCALRHAPPFTTIAADDGEALEHAALIFPDRGPWTIVERCSYITEESEVQQSVAATETEAWVAARGIDAGAAIARDRDRRLTEDDVRRIVREELARMEQERAGR